MVRKHREVERPTQTRGARSLAVGTVGLQADRLAFREAVRVPWRVPGVLPVRVERVRRMHVRIAEEGLTIRLVLTTSRTLLRVGPLRFRARFRRNQVTDPSDHQCDQ